MGKKNKKAKNKIGQSKVMQCCYCGVQSAFLPDRAVHTLVCETCAAPLSVQKQRPTAAHKGVMIPHGAVGKTKKLNKRGKPTKKKKSIFAKLIDLADDLVDEVFD